MTAAIERDSSIGGELKSAVDLALESRITPPTP
jgi:hypothetical protein